MATKKIIVASKIITSTVRPEDVYAKYLDELDIISETDGLNGKVLIVLNKRTNVSFPCMESDVEELDIEVKEESLGKLAELKEVSSPVIPLDKYTKFVYDTPAVSEVSIKKEVKAKKAKEDAKKKPSQQSLF